MNLGKICNRIIGHLPLTISLLCAALIRIFYVFATPIYNPDEGYPFIMAMEFAKSGRFNALMPLSTILNGILLKTIGYHFFIGRLTEAIAGIATVFVVYKLCVIAYNRRIAFISSIFLAFLPLHVIFSFVWKTYGLATLFITLATFLLYKSLVSRKLYLSFLGGFMVLLAFLCKTFNLVYLAGIPLVIILGKIYPPDKETRRTQVADVRYPAVLLLSSLFFLIPVFIWRIRLYGRYFYYDYGNEWISEAIFSWTRYVWEGMVSYIGTAYFILLPLLILFMAISLKEKEYRRINIAIISFVSSYLAFTFFNPVQHQTNLIVPISPLICIAAGYALDYLLKNKGYVKPALLLTVSLAGAFFLKQFYLRKLFVTSVYLRDLLAVSAQILYVYLAIFPASLILFIALFRIFIRRSGVNRVHFYFESIGQACLVIIICVYVLFAQVFLAREAGRKADESLGVIEALEYSPPAGEILMYDYSTYGAAMGRRIIELSSNGKDECAGLLLGDIDILRRKGVRMMIMPPAEDFRAQENRFITQSAGGKEPCFFQKVLSSPMMLRIFDNDSQIVAYFPFKEGHAEGNDNSRAGNIRAAWPFMHLERTQVFFPWFLIRGSEFSFSGNRYPVNIEDKYSEGLFYYLNLGEKGKNFRIGDTFRIGGLDLSVLFISNDGSYAVIMPVALNSSGDFNFSFIISNSGRRIHRYKYEVIESGNSLEAQAFSSEGSDGWILVNHENHPLWFSDKIMEVNVAGDKNRKATLESGVDLKGGEYYVYAWMRQAGGYRNPGRAYLRFYFNGALINRIPGFIKGDNDRIGWVYIGRVKQGSSGEPVLAISAENDDNMGEARAELGRVIFVHAGSLLQKDDDPLDGFRQTGECVVPPGSKKKTTVFLRKKKATRSKIDVFVYDETYNSSYNISFWNERKI